MRQAVSMPRASAAAATSAGFARAARYVSVRRRARMSQVPVVGADGAGVEVAGGQMLEDEKVVEGLKARAERYKARGRWVAALTAIIAAVYAALLTVGVVVSGEEETRLFGLPPATPEEARPAALFVVGYGGMTAVLSALVTIREAGHRRQVVALAAGMVVIVPVSVAIQMEAPLVAAPQMIGLFTSGALAFIGLFVQDELAIKAEEIEERAKDQERALRRRERAAVESEVAQWRAETERLQKRAARRARWWGLRRGSE